MEADNVQGYIALKNAPDLVPDLVGRFDLSIVEQRFEYDECEAYLPFIRAGKPVLSAEYDERYVDDRATRSQLCTRARRLGLHNLILPLELDDSFRYSCD